MARIGVLALQGDFDAHLRALEAVGADAVGIRRAADVLGLDGLVLPGGESTTVLNLMGDEPWFEAIRRHHAEGGAVLATCAGAILVSRKVLNPEQPSLGLLDATIERNGWGRQVDSFEAEMDVPVLGGVVEAVFIRAPRFRKLGRAVEVLGRARGEPVVVRQGRLLAMTFHPELTPDRRLHRRFLEIASAASAEREDIEGDRRAVAS